MFGSPWEKKYTGVFDFDGEEEVNDMAIECRADWRDEKAAGERKVERFKETFVAV